MSISVFLCLLIMGFMVFSFTVSPVLLIMWLVFLSILSSLYMYSFSKWMMYMIIMLYIGGMMVLFSYMVSLSEKNKSTMKLKKLIFFSLFVLMVMVNLFYIKGSVLSELFMCSSSMILYVMIFYLLFLLCSISKLLVKKNGSLKSLFLHE